MLQDTLREHILSAGAIRRRAEARIDRQFAPLKKELERCIKSDRMRLEHAQSMHPDNSCYAYDRLEPKIFNSLEELLRNRIAAYYRALSGDIVDEIRTSTMTLDRVFTLNEVAGDIFITDDEVTQLITSCVHAFLPAFQLSEVIVATTHSYEDSDAYVKFSVPTFP